MNKHGVERKRKEIEFHDKVRGKALLENEAEYEYLTSNRKFYSIVRSSRDFVNEWLGQRCPGKKALDYCCGNGGVSLFVAKSGAEAIGIDISGESIKNARDNAICEKVASNASFLIMDAENLAFAKGSFDIIICSGVLHHLDIQRAFPELARVLKPNGKIICAEPLAYNPVIQAYRKMTPYLRTEWEAEHILNRGCLELAGKYFSKIEIKFFHLATLAAVPFRNLPVFDSVLSLLEAIDRVLLRLPGVKWLAWQIVFILSQPKKHR